jgi:hypothetical protein
VCALVLVPEEECAALKHHNDKSPIDGGMRLCARGCPYAHNFGCILHRSKCVQRCANDTLIWASHRSIWTKP